MPYANKDQLITDLLPKSTSTAEREAIGRILDGVSAFVDTYCGRPPGHFNPAAADASEKRVRGEGEHFLRLPVHVFDSIESVTLRGVAIPPKDYYESERNGWLYLENSAPGLESTFGDCFDRRWLRGEPYRVIARWGYAATPADLQEAVRQTVVRIWQTNKGTFGQINPETGFVIERAMPPFAREVLDRYKRRPFEIS